MYIRPARVEDRGPLLELWERSVRATHHFLSDGDVVALRPLVAQELAGDTCEWWVLVSPTEDRLGFLGMTKAAIEGLFIDPAYRGQGGGKLLVEHAQCLAGGALAVDVNEQNEAALEFYQRLGFSVVGRSATDAGGRPFPLLHLKRAAPGGPKER